MGLAVLGRYTKLHGTGGRVTISSSNAALAGEMCVPQTALLDTIKRLPHVHVEEGTKRHGEFTVTWENWIKYQVDSTQAERQSASRSKRRRDEKRGDEKRGDEKRRTRGVLSDAQFIAALRSNSAYQGIDLDTELAKMDAYLLTPKARGRKKTRGFIVAWLNRIDRGIPSAAPADPEAPTMGATPRPPATLTCSPGRWSGSATVTD